MSQFSWFFIFIIHLRGAIRNEVNDINLFEYLRSLIVLNAKYGNLYYKFKKCNLYNLLCDKKKRKKNS